MKGWSFIQFDKRGRPRAQGQVVDQVGDGRYLCQFLAGDKTHAEVVESKNMETWQLFPDREALEAYMQAIAKEVAESQKSAADATGGNGEGGEPGGGSDDAAGNGDPASALERVPKESGESDPEEQTPSENVSESNNETHVNEADDEAGAG